MSSLAVSSNGRFSSCIASNCKTLERAGLQLFPLSIYACFLLCLTLMLLDDSSLSHPTAMILLHLWPEDVICTGCYRTQNAAVCAAIIFPVCRHHGVLSASGHSVFYSLLFCVFEGTCLLKSRNHHRN